jgi:hypothetical protein
MGLRIHARLVCIRKINAGLIDRANMFFLVPRTPGRSNNVIWNIQSTVFKKKNYTAELAFKKINVVPEISYPATAYPWQDKTRQK